AFGLTKDQYGLINTARDWCYAVGQFVNGLFTDKLGGKQAMAVGAAATIALNVAFGTVPELGIAVGTSALLFAFVTIRGLDGYFQAFGAPGMIKVNAAWFPRAERGRFAGIFGLMIQFGRIAINNIGPLLLAGVTIPLVFWTLEIPKGDWRTLFYLPPIAVAVITIIMYAVVRNE